MSNTSLDWYDFTEDERELLVRSWALIQPHKQDVGCDIYQMIFNQCPETRYLFPKLDTTMSKKDLRKNNEFVFQALRFMQVIESAMRNLDSLNNMNTILDNLGRRHGKLELVGKFRPYYWSVFIEAVIFQFRRFLEGNRKFHDKDVDGAIIVWRYLLRDVIHRIKVGYINDIDHRLGQLESGCQSRKISLAVDGYEGGCQRPQNGCGSILRQATIEDDASDDFRESRVLPRHPYHGSHSIDSNGRKKFIKTCSYPEEPDEVQY